VLLGVDEEDALAGLRLLPAALPHPAPAAPLAERGLRLGAAHGLPACDRLYLALALRERCPLVTADAAPARSAGPVPGYVLTPEEAALRLQQPAPGARGPPCPVRAVPHAPPMC
jgi:hypothetical protein